MIKNVILTTLVVILDERHENVLLVNRRKRNWQGYAAPGGHVNYPESLMDCAIREVWEETGLTVTGLKLMSISHFEGINEDESYFVFNYMTDQYSGDIQPGVGEDPVQWIPLERLDDYPLAEGFKIRLEAMLRGEHDEFYQTWSRQEDGSTVTENIVIYSM